MPRAVNGTIHKNRRRKILKAAKGVRGGRSKLYNGLIETEELKKENLEAYGSLESMLQFERTAYLILSLCIP